MKNEIVFSEEEIDGITTSLASSYMNVANTGEAINPNFSGAVNVGLLGNSIGVISSQMSSISDSINNTQGLLDEYKNQLVTYDSNMALKIDDIEIPQDFMANNSSKVNTFTQSLLSKIDGKSVNEGSSVSDTYDTFESTISDKALGDITSGSIGNQEYDDASNIAREDELNNISNLANTELEVYDDNSSIEDDFDLIDMIPRDIMDDLYYDDSSNIKEESLADISNGTYTEAFDEYKYVDEEIDYYINKLREKA